MVIYHPPRTQDWESLNIHYRIKDLGKYSIELHKNIYTIENFNMAFIDGKVKIKLYTLKLLKEGILTRVIKTQSTGKDNILDLCFYKNE